MLLLGVLQAQAAGQVAAGSFDLLEQRVLDTAQSSVTFSSLSTYAADYQHLQIRGTARAVRSPDTDNYMQLEMNATGGTSYANHSLRGNGSSVVSSAMTSQASMRIANGSLATTSSTANAFTGFVIDILDPFETTKNTTVRTLIGRADSLNIVELSSGVFLSTGALTQMRLFNVYGDFVQYSRFSLYGIRGG